MTQRHKTTFWTSQLKHDDSRCPERVSDVRAFPPACEHSSPTGGPRDATTAPSTAPCFATYPSPAEIFKLTSHLQDRHGVGTRGFVRIFLPRHQTFIEPLSSGDVRCGAEAAGVHASWPVKRRGFGCEGTCTESAKSECVNPPSRGCRLSCSLAGKSRCKIRFRAHSTIA